MLRFTDNCKFKDLKPQILLAIYVSEQVYLAYNVPEMWLTSVDDSTHGSNSLHYSGNAIDIRTRNIPGGYTGEKAKLIHAAIKARLGKEFDVVLESNHIHIEYDPK